MGLLTTEPSHAEPLFALTSEGVECLRAVSEACRILELSFTATLSVVEKSAVGSAGLVE